MQRISPRRVDLGGVLQDVLRQCSAGFAERNIRLQRLQVTDGLTVYADIQSLRQVLTLVLDNLIRFCGDATVEISSEPLGPDLAAVRIADTGPGIPDHVMGEIFSPFFTSRSMVRRSGQGAGLGLPICHRLMQAQGGEIRIDKRHGGGTEVTICLPRGGDGLATA